MTKKHKRIMVVDDDVELLEELTDLLTDKGYETTTFTSGGAAAREAQKSLPDLILLDLKMEGKNGFITAAELTRANTTAHIPILGMTGHYKGRMYAHLMNIIGFRGCLVKPIDPEKLLSTIADLLEE